MKTLFLDTSSFLVNVTVLNNKTIIHTHTEKNDNKLSDRIFDIIEDCFEKSGIKGKDIERIFVVNGPGSFTGIRIGLTIAKTMAWSLKIPVYKVSTLELMLSGANEDAIALIKDRNDFTYYGKYSSNLDIIDNDFYCLLGSVDTENISVYSYDEFDFQVKTPLIDIPRLIIKHENDEIMDPHLLAPNYLKRTDAEKSVSLD